MHLQGIEAAYDRTERGDVHRKENQGKQPDPAGKVVFGLWNRGSGAVCITDELPAVSERIRLGFDVIRVYADGWELELLGNHGNIAMVHMNRRVYGEIQSM